jgi:hypothetical protein
MFKYIFALIALIVIFSLPFNSLAQDGQEPNSLDNKTVAPITSFDALNICIFKDGQPVMRFFLTDEGQASCTHMQTTVSGDFQKKVTTQVFDKLTADELKNIREAFATLNITTLKSNNDNDELDDCIIIIGSNGSHLAKYMAHNNQYGDDAGKVTPFLQAVKKITDRLK